MARSAEVLPGSDGSAALLDGYKRLMAGVLLQAACDARAKDAALRIEALCWLASDEARQMCDVLELPDLLPAVIAGKTPALRRGWRILTNDYRRGG